MEDIFGDDRVLVGVDGSGPSIDALRHGARIAGALGSPLAVVATWTYPVYMSPYVYESWSPEPGVRTMLDAAIKRAFGDSPPALERIVRLGPAARTLIEESARSAMLVLGSRGHGGFAGLLLGSVSAACAEHAHCPVLIVHDRHTVAADSDEETRQGHQHD